jgi:hypothetical protein
MRLRPRSLPALFAALLSACADLPPADPAVGKAPPPALLPLDRLLAGVDAGSGRSPETALADRAARLRARAALMRGPVLDPATRARLAAAIRDGRA